jgi:DNA-binding PadR family transcriptional regulator
MTGRSAGGLSRLEYHALLAMANGPLYGYAIKEAVEIESAGTLTPRAGSLYRVLARLMTGGLVVETEPAEATSPHPGRERRYYGLTAEGRRALAAEARRQRGAAALAEERLGTRDSRP